MGGLARFVCLNEHDVTRGQKATLFSGHREHTILLSRERVNKGTKRMNSLPLSSLVISFILRDFTAKTAAYKSCIILKC